MKLKKAIIQISNKTKNKNQYEVSNLNIECIVLKLPVVGEIKTYEVKVKIFNNTKITKSLILSALNSGKNYYDGMFELEFKYPILSEYDIEWAFEKACFKYSVVSIIEYVD